MRIQPVEFETGRKLEWLETNGLGGFASSTIVGMNTRRYHGLLTAALHPPVGRVVMLSKLEETLVIGERRFDLSVNQYPGAIHPTGHQLLREFRLDPWPTFVFSADGVEIEKSVFLVNGENTVVVRYEMVSKSVESCRLEVRPMVAFRDYHSTTHRNDGLDRSVDFEDGLASIQPYGDLPRLFFAHDASQAEATGHWYNNFEYDVERERGLDFREDLFNPLKLTFALDRGATLIASMEQHTVNDAPELRELERARRREIVDAAPLDHPLVRTLTAAADQFIVRRGAGKSIIAGYHWFSDWGRDTMIALPGLTLVTRRFEVARDILRAFAGSVDRGMLPNRFPDAGETPEYNTVDATLWFFEAVRAYFAYTGDFEFVGREMLPVLQDILDWHLKGTRYGIRADADGLLACGEPGVQLTWMDVKIGDWVVTPRTGKPVEVQALWYNALRVAADLSRHAGGVTEADFFEQLAGRARESFLEQFWNAGEQCLYDVVDGGFRDGALRPNQIFAVSLHYPLLTGERARQVVEAVQRDLLTPVGLRSLSPRDSRYRGRYEGGVFERDSSYHQGTVWPWLTGPFLTAYCKTGGDHEQARAWFEGCGTLLERGCLGQVCEITDGDAPHLVRGCVAQAWSAGELLRAAVEDLYGISEERLGFPSYEIPIQTAG
jgi:predicted glycogen debranching enzyme